MNIFCNIGQDHSFTFNQCLSLVDSFKQQVNSDDEFDLWPVYSGERFRAS